MFAVASVALLLAATASVMPAQGDPPKPTGGMQGMMMGQGVPMDRMGSGTTWIPDAAPLPSRHFEAAGWTMMLHGFAFAQYNNQGGARGGSQFGSLNWGMLMASRELGGGRFEARTMLSLDGLGVGGRGYPLLLQSGERYGGVPIHDRQHPHDFWMELGVLYDHALAGPLSLSLYAAPSGEPALGPVAFMHRPSAMDLPLAPIGHHWQDATHVSFGVLTAGLSTTQWKAEASVFNSREPDEHRWNFDRMRLDSYSGRITVNPNERWSIAAGYGYLKTPEAGRPSESLHRLTASVLHGARIGAAGQWATTLLWGANASSEQSGWSHSALLESEAALDARTTLLGRVEVAQKSAEDLVLDVPPSGFPSGRRFDVASGSLGYVRELRQGRGATLGLGCVATINLVPAALETTYGSRMPLGGVVFVRLRPVRASGISMGQMNMKHTAQ